MRTPEDDYTGIWSRIYSMGTTHDRYQLTDAEIEERLDRIVKMAKGRIKSIRKARAQVV